MPVFSWERFMATSQTFFTSFFLTVEMVTSGVILAIWLAMFAIAWITGSRPLRFAWLFLMLSAIPLRSSFPAAQRNTTFNSLGGFFIPQPSWCAAHNIYGSIYPAKRLLNSRRCGFPRSL